MGADPAGINRREEIFAHVAGDALAHPAFLEPFSRKATKRERMSVLIDHQAQHCPPQRNAYCPTAIAARKPSDGFRTTGLMTMSENLQT